jgi:hypothetical protein
MSEVMSLADYAIQQAEKRREQERLGREEQDRQRLERQRAEEEALAVPLIEGLKEMLGAGYEWNWVYCEPGGRWVVVTDDRAEVLLRLEPVSERIVHRPRVMAYIATESDRPSVLGERYMRGPRINCLADLGDHLLDAARQPGAVE